MNNNIQPIQALEELLSTMEPCPRLLYLENMTTAIRDGQLLFVNMDTNEDATATVYTWMKEELQKTAIPPDYFAWCITDLLSTTHPLSRDHMTLHLVRLLGPLTKEQARAQPHSLDYTDEQFDVLFEQMSLWVATHEPRPGGLQ